MIKYWTNEHNEPVIYSTKDKNQTGSCVVKPLLEDILEIQEQNERLLKIAKKMHTWIFLYTDNEQKVYDELGLTDEENRILGYGGQFILEDKENER